MTHPALNLDLYRNISLAVTLRKSHSRVHTLIKVLCAILNLVKGIGCISTKLPGRTTLLSTP